MWSSSSARRHAPFWGGAAALLLLLAGATSLRAQEPVAQAVGAGSAVPPGATGADIFRAACAACHGEDGTGVARVAVGFAQDLPDFTDCQFATAEPFPDWVAVVHQGGPIRALDRHMPAFHDALTANEIDRVVQHLYTFCTNPAWPRGDLNFPRLLFTEKAFPENELVLTMSGSGADGTRLGAEMQYERRFGSRSQIEVTVPVAMEQAGGAWTRGLGDVNIAFKQALHANVERGRIVSAGAEVVLPTGKEAAGFGGGVTIFEPFVMAGQAIGGTGFAQVHAGLEVPADRSKAPREGYARAAIGASLIEDRGFGRAWTPMVEVLWARPEGERSEWDVVPQMQVTLSKLQHVMVSGGVRIPVNARGERHPQVVTYFLWDWFDGSLFEFWR